MGAYVYLLKCLDGSHYVGSATGDDIGKRVAEHQAGRWDDYTATRRPVFLVWWGFFERLSDAVLAEYKIRSWSWASREALARGDEAQAEVLTNALGVRFGRSEPVRAASG